MDAYLAIADGSVLRGRGRVPGTAQGELVFTTAYSGYEESLTDPSYAKQVLTFAYPLIGNYGVRSERFESDRVHPTAAVARELTDEVVEWLDAENVPAVDDIDTRSVVRRIREQGAMRCGIAVGETVEPADARAQLDACPPMGTHTDIGDHVSVDELHRHLPTGSSRDIDVALLDCGVKRSIVRSFQRRGATVHQFPHDAKRDSIAAVEPDLFFISNGPGDPAVFKQAERLVSAFTHELPIAGICLGQQVIARALGGETAKLPFGHRGVNQPVRDRDTGQVLITTQNHGYTVSDAGPLSVTQVNVNDGSAEGLRDERRRILTRQYHPEAHPGPRDSLGFFDDVLEMALESDSIRVR